MYAKEREELKSLIQRVKASCEEGIRGLTYMYTNEDNEDEEGRIWEPDVDGFEVMIGDLEAALTIIEGEEPVNG